MKKMRKGNIKAFCMTTFLAGVIFSTSVFATELDIQTTKEYEDWTQLVAEEKENTLMPKTYSQVIPDEYLEEASESKVPSIVNELIGNISSKTEKPNLDNIEAAYQDSRYNIAEKLSLRVEHQGKTTECWAFAMIKSLETNIALRSGVTEIPDFSERHMDYATSKTFSDGINNLGFEREVGTGGLPVAALAYLTNGQGAVLESDMPFEDNENKIPLASIEKEVDTVVTEYVSLPVLNKKYTTDENGNTISVTYTDSKGNYYTQEEVTAIRNIIKKHIVEDGAVPSLTAGNKTKYYNTPNDISKATAYNCNTTTVTRDHGITIVGWDDNYSRDNFAEGTKPSTDGAYIVLNSYGTENFGNGYLYVSYEDFFIESEIYVVKNSEKKDYDNIYQADFYGGIFSMGTKSTDTGYYANTYARDISKTEVIKNVGVTVSDYVKLEIYLNPNSSTINMNEMIKVGETSEVLEPGYHRIDITPTKLNGDEFAIVVKQISENDIFYFSIETPVNNSAYASVTSDHNSYYSIDGSSWRNLADIEVAGFDMKKTDVCIKAFTVENEEEDNNNNNNNNNTNDNTSNGDNNQNEGNTSNGDNNQNNDGNTAEDNNNQNNQEEKPITLTSEVYLITENDEVYKIAYNTKIKDFKENVTTDSKIKFMDSENEVTDENQIIKTGMKIVLDDTREYELIVRGDINCDGNVSLTDLSKMILHYNETRDYILTGSALKAADMNYDFKVSLIDVSQLLILYNSI